MLFSFFRDQRRRRLAAAPFPAEWEETLRRNVWHYGRMDAAAREKLRLGLRILLAEKNWEACGGVVLTDEARVTLAANAAILVLGFERYYFDDLRSVLVYPGGFWVERDAGGGPEHLLGEAHSEGPVVVSWWGEDAGRLRMAWASAVVLHEFAHHLDMLDGEPDGLPGIPNRGRRQTWKGAMDEELSRYRRNERKGRETLLSFYELDDDAELFAFATECFFSFPRRFKREYPGLYGILQDFYRQDPAERFGDRPESPHEVLEPGEDAGA
jgi:hypothetical protein